MSTLVFPVTPTKGLIWNLHLEPHVPANKQFCIPGGTYLPPGQTHTRSGYSSFELKKPSDRINFFIIFSLIKLCSFVADERKKYTIYPKAENVFSWTTACKLRDVKVVILGQDPYHGPNQAHGKALTSL